MKRVAVIIKHPYRTNDYRIDMIEVDDTWTGKQIREQIELEMLGPFEVIGLTMQIKERNFPYLPRTQENEQNLI